MYYRNFSKSFYQDVDPCEVNPHTVMKMQKSYQELQDLEKVLPAIVATAGRAAIGNVAKIAAKNFGKKALIGAAKTAAVNTAKSAKDKLSQASDTIREEYAKQNQRV